MSAEPPQHSGRRVSETTARHEAVTLAAYHEALGEFTAFRWSRNLLLEQLGDVDAQATHPVPEARLALAGRLIAAAQVAERVRLPDPQVYGIVRAWLANREAERDNAAPTLVPRLPPEDERIDGLTRRLTDSKLDGGFSRAAWGIAGMVLQELIRPTVDISRALTVRETLDPLVGTALSLSETMPAAIEAAVDPPSCLLTRTVLRMRADGRIVTDGAREHAERRGAWLRIAADTARAHARWRHEPIDRSIARALARATDRLAASLVPDEHERFDHEAAVEHAVQAAFDAAVTALGLAIRPEDPIFVRGKHDVLETMMEAASSALIGAWVLDRSI